MNSPDLDYIIKYLKKQHNKWPSEKIEEKATEILKKYLDYHKDIIAQKKIEELQKNEKDLDRESLQWWLIWKTGEL